jgi:hypothetical protein
MAAFLPIFIERKEKITPVFSYRRDFAPIGLILTMVFSDVVYGFIPYLGRWALMGHEYPFLLVWRDKCLFVV